MSASKSSIVDYTKDDVMQRIFPSTALVSSSNMDWKGIHLGLYRHPPYSVPENCSQQHLILIHPQIPQDMRLEQRFDGRFDRTQIQSGDIIVIPANTPHQAS